MGFIASCLNGNLEKMLLSITPAIVKFYPLELEEETEEQKLQTLKNAVTGSLFQKYFESVEDVAGPTLDGYKNYIQTNPEFNNKEELRQKYLELLKDQTIIDKITETITIMSGEGKRNTLNVEKRLNAKRLNARLLNARLLNARRIRKYIRKYIRKQ